MLSLLFAAFTFKKGTQPFVIVTSSPLELSGISPKGLARPLGQPLTFMQEGRPPQENPIAIELLPKNPSCGR